MAELREVYTCLGMNCDANKLDGSLLVNRAWRDSRDYLSGSGTRFWFSAPSKSQLESSSDSKGFCCLGSRGIVVDKSLTRQQHFIHLDSKGRITVPARDNLLWNF